MLIAPSMLCADFGSLREDARRLTQAGADWLHFDVMDGHFVPNLTHGVLPVQAVRADTELPLDVHFMVERPEVYAEAAAEAGADWFTFHLEATRAPHRLARLVRSLGMKAGLALCPATPVELAEPLLEEVDLVLVMSVDPGFAGQAFLPGALSKIRALRGMIGGRGREALVEVDGGIKRDTVGAVRAAGAEVLVSGSGIFAHPQGLQAAIAELRNSAPA